MNILIAFLVRRIAGRLGWFIASHLATLAGGYLIRHLICGR